MKFCTRERITWTNESVAPGCHNYIPQYTDMFDINEKTFVDKIQQPQTFIYGFVGDSDLYTCHVSLLSLVFTQSAVLPVFLLTACLKQYTLICR